MQRRSTTIFLIGLLTLVLGAATTFAAVRGPKRAAADTGAKSRNSTRAQVAPGQPANFTIPEGKQALAVALDTVAGTAGTAVKGSHVDVFAAVTVKPAKTGDPETHATRMVLQDVEVLTVDNGTTLPGTNNAVDKAGPNATTTFVLAVTPAQAESIVYHASFSKLWFSVLPANAKPVAPTAGIDTAHQLDPVAG
jgi:Flp pilus assembly protein CpaB